MSYISLKGGRRLSGEVTVQGAKNSVLPILAAAVMSGSVCRIGRCPRLSDVETTIDILRHLGCGVRWEGTVLVVDATTVSCWDIPDTLMRRMRSSVIFLGAILSRCGRAEPGSTRIATRT